MVDADGEKIGTIEDILLDRQTGEPAWAAVKTGLFGLKHSHFRAAAVAGYAPAARSPSPLHGR